MFFSKIKDFSKENWWIYIFLVITLVLVYVTWKWSISEISIIFLLNFLWNLFIMIMQDYYTVSTFKKWALFHVLSVIIFTSVSLYWFLAHNQYQYLIWQIMYIWAAIKAFMFYNFWKNLKAFNEYSFLFINTMLLFVFLLFIQHDSFAVLQAIWFGLITSWLVSIKDKVRYWLNVVWIAFLISGSVWWVVSSYITWSIDAISLGYLLLTLATFVFYLKLSPNYLKKDKKKNKKKDN